MLHSGKLTGRNRTWTLNEDVLLVEHGDIPASYVSLLEGVCFVTLYFLMRKVSV